MASAPSTAVRATALVPLRSVVAGKTRLAVVLPAEARRALIEGLFRGVVRALRGAEVERTVVLAGDDSAVDLAVSLGLEVHQDEASGGLNAAARHGLSMVRPGSATLVVMPDLPLLAADDVRRLCTADADVVVAPARDGGTSGLACRPGVLPELAYGPASAARHVALVRRAGLTCEVRHLAGFAHDVDVAQDLQVLGRTRHGARDGQRPGSGARAAKGPGGEHG